MASHRDVPLLLKKDDFLNDAPVFQNICRQFDVYSESVGLSELHQHQFIEISIVTGGTGIHRIWNAEYTCHSGSICILNSAVPHGYFIKDKEADFEVCNLLFDVKDILKGEAARIGSEKYMFGLFSSNNFAVQIMLTQKQLDFIQSIYKNIADEISQKKDSWQEALRSYITLFLISAARIAEENAVHLQREASSDQKAVAKAVQIVNSMYADPDFSLEYIAEALYTSKASASRMFKAVTGEYFSDYLRYIRMEKAAEIIEKTNLPNDEIALQCGYSDVQSFCTQFKNTFGKPPGQYRKLIRKEKTDKQKEIYILTEKEQKQMSILQEISEKLQKGKAKDVTALVTQALEENIAPNVILNEGLVSGMNIIGDKFRNNQVFVPEVLVAARAMNAGLKILKPALSVAGVEPLGKAVICTVKGDMHDIGKNLVKMMIEGQGIECIDLGVDVDPAKIVDTVKESGAQIVCLSALLTTTMMGQKDVIDALIAAGIRDKVKVMVGGAPITQEFADEIGADCYTLDAASAAIEAKRLITELNA